MHREQPDSGGERHFLNTLRIVQVFFILLLTVSLIPVVNAIEPAWIYPMKDAEIGNIAVSADGSTIVVSADNLWIFSKNGTFIKKEPYGKTVVLTPNGRYAASFLGGTIYFFRSPLTTGSSDPKELNRVWEYSFPNPVRSIDITDDGTTIAGATESNGIFIITTLSQKVVSSNLFPNILFGISHDGRRIVGISADMIRVYGSNAKVSRSYNPKSVSQPGFMVFSQTVPLMVFNDGQNIRGFDVSLGTDLWTVRATGNPISLAMTPSGSLIVAGMENGNIDRYDDKGVLLWSYSSTPENSLTAGISGVALSKDGKLVAGGTTDGTVLILDASGKLQGSYKAKEPIRSVTMSKDGSLVLAAGEENIYAFFTTPSSGSSSTPVSYYQFDPKNQTPGFNTSGQNITQTQTPPSGNPPLTTPSVRSTITELPTTYSIIRTATQSPVHPIISLMGIAGAVLLLIVRRR